MIEVQNLSKYYGQTKAVNNVSFTLGKDQVLGFLGPNGAGKTTIMKILTGYHFPTEGTALVDGISVQDFPVEVKKRVGYLPETVPLYGDLTVDEYLSFIAAARLIPADKRKAAVKAGLEACGLCAWRSRRIETLSRGYKQRVGLAQAIIHDPPVLILDEPTSGLDPNQIIEIRSLIRELGKRKTLILSTHILQELEAVCSRVLILSEGRIAAQGRPGEIAGAMKGGDTWELVLKGAPPGSIGEKLARLGKGLVPAKVEDLGNGLSGLSFFIPRGEDALGEGEGGESSVGEGIFDWAVAEKLKILRMNRKKVSLEDIFVKLTREPLTREPPGGEGGPV